MKKSMNQLVFTLFCCIFLFLLIFYSKECIILASNGLLIWYKNMIPTLFPFMVLSGFMIRSGLSLKIGQWMQPFLGIIFRLPPQMLYAIFMGFLCGFPMGAKIVADMLEKEQITQKEGEYLLSFCNNIGPLYMLGYVIPLFHYENILKTLGLMYLIPFGYGLVLRYLTRYKKFVQGKKNPEMILSACSNTHDMISSPDYLSCFQQALSSAIEQITLLGGCMVFFNCLQIFPQIINSFFSSASSQHTPFFSDILCSFIEIGGGLKRLSGSAHIFNSSVLLYLPLSLLTFGGLSCIAQTYFIIKNTGLNISTYIKHKFIQSCIYIIFFLHF